ncbi:response regulator [Deinococcus sedimenti]|uniref:Response regulatory domain-containing protein n=1 Tax=Deinococcus sedimenti TaxID=1867090 RepID=A0ABQ2S0C5_9DEIO|nr:response regulator [Deinococcus sedimenti]GGR84837.1 hypothetical protein GCM10008960_09820 [Deinococcus sedimenti]
MIDDDLTELALAHALLLDEHPDWSFRGSPHLAPLLPLLRAPASHPRLLLLDVHMPGQMGVDVLRQLRACAPTSLHVVMLASHDDARDRRAARQAGADGFHLKPVDPGAYRHLLYTLIRQVTDPNGTSSRLDSATS